MARAQKEVGVLCSADHGKSLCLGFFDFKNSLLASKVKLFKLLVMFLKKKRCSWQRGFQKNPLHPPFVWSYPHPRDFLRAAIMLFSRPEIVI